jgi:phage FluMu gp28-like protein
MSNNNQSIKKNERINFNDQRKNKHNHSHIQGIYMPPTPPKKNKKRDYLGRDFPRTMTIKYQILTADGKAISHRKSIELHLQNPDYRYNNMIIIHFFFFFTLDGQ